MASLSTASTASSFGGPPHGGAAAPGTDRPASSGATRAWPPRVRRASPASPVLAVLVLVGCDPAPEASPPEDRETAEAVEPGRPTPSRAAAAPSRPDEYAPAPGAPWVRRDPATVGMDPYLLGEAVEYALAHETTEIPEDPGVYLRERFRGLPDQEIVGPTTDRGGVSGMILRDGYIVAEFGDTDREDMTFSVTKSYLSTLAGLAWAAGLIPDLDAPVSELVSDGTFAGPRNGAITWRHLLQQTSEWEGTLFGKPDRADRREGTDRTLQPPGTFWEYNDVRVNLLAYALLQRLKRPLPEVLAQEIMDPIGASDDWRWHGYRTSWVEVEGTPMQSVSGGGHWGGGLFIDTEDHARFGLLALRFGRWGNRQIIPAAWFTLATSPVDIHPGYGFMWWLNTDRGLLPAAPASAFMAVGAGWTNVIYVDRENRLVTVTRWLDGPQHVNGFVSRVLASIGVRERPSEAGG